MERWRRGPILGRGSSATVSLATAFPSGELFAVKSADLSKSDHLQNEQRILGSINCPQIVSYLGFQLTSLRFNLFIEYAPGGSLSHLLKNHGGRLDEPAVQSHTYDLLTGLSYLHYRGIVHCDVKPDNILIGLDGRTKIADLGCARWMDEDSYQVKGTPMYMAPEVARGEEQGPAADVWALGCTVRAGNGSGSGRVTPIPVPYPIRLSGGTWRYSNDSKIGKSNHRGYLQWEQPHHS